jgi:DNA invertase Pin-like site-specific DNA recombinase
VLELVRKGVVKSLLVKDFSRWGRCYITVCEHLEQVFPFLGVRFISVNDEYDSAKNAGRTLELSTAFKTLIHDYYSKELGGKIKQSLHRKAEKGECISFPKFGYKKSDVEKNVLVIDNSAAEIVRRIFNMAVEGVNCTEIASILNGENVDTPFMYGIKNGVKHIKTTDDKANKWTNATVRHIIQSEEYTGKLIYGKLSVCKTGSKKFVPNPRSEWTIIDGAMPQIVSMGTFEKAQTVFAKISPFGNREVKNPFAGKVKCGYCGHQLHRNVSAKWNTFCCRYYLKTSDVVCFEGKIAEDDIIAAVRDSVKTIATAQNSVPQKQNSVNNSKPNTKLLTDRIKFLEHEKVDLFEQYCDEKLTKEQFVTEKNRRSSAISELEMRIADCTAAAETPIAENNVTVSADADITELLKHVKVIRVFGKDNIVAELVS